MKSKANYLKKLQSKISFLLVALTFFFPQISTGASFTDVPQTSSYYIPVEALKQLKIIQGYEDGTYKPEQKVNRAEALKMILKGAGYNIKQGLYSTGFKDVPIDAWYAGYIMEGALQNIINGNPDGTFAPERTVNEAEYLKITLNSFKIDLTHHENIKNPISNDTTTTDWYIKYLSYAKTVGLIYPDINNNLYPGKELTRGDCATILYKTYLIKQNGEAQKYLFISEAKLIDGLIKIYNKDNKGAIDDATQAKNYANLALTNTPDSTTAKASIKIAEAFKDLFKAYEENNKNNKSTAIKLAESSIKKAEEAVKINSSAQILTTKLKTYANNLTQIQ